MSRTKTRNVAIADLQQVIFVRTELNRDHAEKLANLMGNGVELPPIHITEKDFIVIDGRHRIEAYEINGLTHIECVVENLTTEAQIIARAHQLNAGGALPPTQRDMEHTISLLLARRVGKRRIPDMLGLPKGMARRFIENVEARMKQKALNQALTAVSSGEVTAVAAAEEFDVDVADLKNAIRGKRKKEKDALNDKMKGIRSLYNGLTRRTKALAKVATEMCLDGQVSVARVEKIFEQLGDLRGKQTRVQADAKRRFVAATTGDD